MHPATYCGITWEGRRAKLNSLGCAAAAFLRLNVSPPKEPDVGTDRTFVKRKTWHLR